MEKERCIIIGILLSLLCVPILAESEISGLIRSGQYSQGTLSSVRQPSQDKQSSDGVYSVGAYPLYTPELAPGEGRGIIHIFCRFCHSTTYITMQPPLPAATRYLMEQGQTGLSVDFDMPTLMGLALPGSGW